MKVRTPARRTVAAFAIGAITGAMLSRLRRTERPRPLAKTARPPLPPLAKTAPPPPPPLAKTAPPPPPPLAKTAPPPAPAVATAPSPAPPVATAPPPAPAVATAPPEAPTAETAPPEAKPRRPRERRDRKQAKLNVESLTKQQLYDEARKRNIPGRSSMTKEQLRRALR